MVGARAPDSGKEEILGSEGVVCTPKASRGLSFQTPPLYPNSPCPRVALAQHVPVRTGLRAGMGVCPAMPPPWSDLTRRRAFSFCLKARAALTSRNVSRTLPTPERAVLLAVASRARGVWAGTARAGVGDAPCTWQRLGVLVRAAAGLSGREGALAGPRAVFSVYFFQSTQLTF